MKLYSIILIATIAVPLLLSFDRKLRFFRGWRNLLPAIFVVALFYIAIDILFTRMGIWGFNPRYHSGYLAGGLPIEEWLFFVVVPYASIFLHDSLQLYFPNFQLNPKQTLWTKRVLLALFWALAFLFFRRAYTLYSCLLMILALNLTYFDRKKTINRLFATFVVILIPFLIVNGLLTGTLIDEEVVWYNPAENMGWRVFTIPAEDFGYGFSLIYLILLLRDKFSKQNKTDETGVNSHIG